MTKLIVEGKPTLEDCYNAWEDILRQNSKETGNLDYLNYFELAQQYSMLIADYYTVTACIIKVSLRNDEDTIDYLMEMGFFIDTTDTQSYAKSIDIAWAKSQNYLTKIMTKQKQLEKYREQEGEKTNIQKALANVSAGMGFEVSDEIKLARFNEYKNIIKARYGRRSSDRKE